MIDSHGLYLLIAAASSVVVLILLIAVVKLNPFLSLLTPGCGSKPSLAPSKQGPAIR
jgi:hypothetical protein